MLKQLYDFIGGFFKAVISVTAYVAATAWVMTLVFILIMTCYRVCGSLWRHIFSEPFP